MFLTHVYNFKYVFNSTIIKLSWHVLYYLISKNLYSLQNAQPFIFQLICMQICKWINYFLKPHNKQLNQYCLNFTIFLPKKKKFFKNGSVSGRVGSGHGSTRFCFRSKKSGSGWVFFGSGRVLSCFAMSTIRPIDINSFYVAMAYGAQRAGKIPQIHGSCLM